MERAVTLEDILAVIDRMSQETKALFKETDAQIKETAARFRETDAQIKATDAELKALFKETDAQIKETDARFKETDAQIKEMAARFKETDAQIKATDAELKALFKETDAQIKEMAARFKETDTQIKATNKKISELGGRLGEIIEYIVSPHLERKFERFGIKLDTIIIEHSLEEPGKGIIAEVDVFLSNGEYVVAVEAKSKPNTQDVAEHINRMIKLRGYANRHNDKRKYLGAIAGMVISKTVKEYAYKCGFPILTPSGDSMELECPEDFIPKEW